MYNIFVFVFENSYNTVVSTPAGLLQVTVFQGHYQEQHEQKLFLDQLPFFPREAVQCFKKQLHAEDFWVLHFPHLQLRGAAQQSAAEAHPSSSSSFWGFCACTAPLGEWRGWVHSSLLCSCVSAYQPDYVYNAYSVYNFLGFIILSNIKKMNVEMERQTYFKANCMTFIVVVSTPTTFVTLQKEKLKTLPTDSTIKHPSHDAWSWS